MTTEAVPTPPGVRPGGDDPLILRLRRGLLLVAALIVAGTAIELAFQHHWTKPVQLVAWAALLLLAIAIGLLVARPTPAARRVVRIIAVVVCAASVLGVVQHVLGNYEAGPLDAEYGETWASMSELGRWWVSFIQAVGPSPALAPGVLVLASICVWIAAPVLPDLPTSEPDVQDVPRGSWRR